MEERKNLKGKITGFVAKHGYTVKALIIASFIFPPAAIFIIFKHPTWSRSQRIVALIGSTPLVLVVPFAGASIVAGCIQLWGKMVGG